MAAQQRFFEIIRPGTDIDLIGKQRYWIVGVQTMFRQSFGQAFEMHDQFAVRKRWRAGRKQRGRVGPTFGHLP